MPGARCCGDPAGGEWQCDPDDLRRVPGHRHGEMTAVGDDSPDTVPRIPRHRGQGSWSGQPTTPPGCSRHGPAASSLLRPMSHPLSPPACHLPWYTLASTLSPSAPRPLSPSPSNPLSPSATHSLSPPPSPASPLSLSAVIPAPTPLAPLAPPPSRRLACAVVSPPGTRDRWRTFVTSSLQGAAARAHEADCNCCSHGALRHLSHRTTTTESPAPPTVSHLLS